MYASLALLRNRNQGYLAVLLMLVSTQFLHLGTDQYGDVPLAFFILSTVALFALKDRFPAKSLQTIVLIGFTASCAAWTKNEGLVFFVWVILVRFIGQIGKSDWSNLIKEFFYPNIENLVLWARSEMIGSAICPIYSWFQVSGFRCQ